MAGLVVGLGGAGRLLAQDSVVVMPAGHYTVLARDSTKTQMGMIGWPFELKGNGDFTFTSPDSLTWSGKLIQKNGVATYTDQGCGDPGVYYVHRAPDGYVLDLKSEACAGRDSALVVLLFRPAKDK